MVRLQPVEGDDMRRPVRSTLVLVALALGATACGGGGGGGGGDDAAGAGADEGGAPPVLQVGWGIPGDEVKYVMIADPERAPNLGTCYDLEWTQLTSTALAVQGLSAGTLDGGTVGSLPAARAIEQGADIVITGQYLTEREGSFSTTWMVRDDGEITGAEDLRGRIVGTSGIGNPTNLAQEYWLEDEAGLVAGEDYEVVEVPYPQMQEALASGRIDMGVFAQPFYGQAAAGGEFRDVFSVTDVVDPLVQLVDAFRREVIEAEPEAVRCYLEDLATIRGLLDDEGNRDAVIDAAAEVTEIPREALASFLLTEDDYFRPEGNELDVEGLQATWDFLAERGGIAEPLQVSDHIEEGFLPPFDR